ncbi:bile acid:sodium symporter family protein [Oscillatoria amoena NRMC-F 0135]|nr:bile acid:sodium symporter family protein [Oscillatoria amoena NRMC-F 0135]
MNDPIRLNFSTENVWILNLCLAVIMFGVALGLKTDDFKRLLATPRSALAGLLSQFVMLPAVTFLFIFLISPPPALALGLILVSSCPGGNISNFMSSLARANVALSVSLTAIGSFLAIILTPLNFQFWGSLYEPAAQQLKTVSVSFADVFSTIIMIAGIPLVMGMVVNAYYPVLAGRLNRWLKPASILIFIGFVVIAFLQNTDVFLKYIHLVFFIVLAHNALAFATGFYMGRLWRTGYNDQRTLAIETGIQNSGLGLALIFTFFNGLGEMAIMAGWWGIWHIISGLGLSYYWARNPVHTL